MKQLVVDAGAGRLLQRGAFVRTSIFDVQAVAVAGAQLERIALRDEIPALPGAALASASREACTIILGNV